MECKCPRCGRVNDDDWPITVEGEVVLGGCQECWEQVCSETWWQAVLAEAE